MINRTEDYEKGRLPMFNIGDQVVTDVIETERFVIRRVTTSDPGRDYGQGPIIWMDGGEKCKECGRTYGTPTKAPATKIYQVNEAQALGYFDK